MSDAVISWILKCWDETKNDYERGREKKELNKLAKQLRLFVNSVRTKSGIPADHKNRAAEMAQYVESEMQQMPWDDKGIAHAIALSVQYARKHLGDTAIQGSAIKGKLSRADRARVRKLSRINKPASGPAQSELSKDDSRSYDIQLDDVDDGDAPLD